MYSLLNWQLKKQTKTVNEGSKALHPNPEIMAWFWANDLPNRLWLLTSPVNTAPPPIWTQIYSLHSIFPSIISPDYPQLAKQRLARFYRVGNWGS